MVTDAAGTGFEIKKPHKGTETFNDLFIIISFWNLKLRNPIRGRKLNPRLAFVGKIINLKLRNPIRGRKR